MKKLFLLLVSLILITGCETIKEIKTQIKPGDGREAVLYAHGQVFIVKEALAYIYGNSQNYETNIDKAITAIVVDKLAAIHEVSLGNTMGAYRSGDIKYEDALKMLSRESSTYEAINTDNLRFNKLKSLIGGIEASLLTVGLAIDTTSTLKACKIEVNGLELPCTTRADYLLVVLLKLRT